MNVVYKKQSDMFLRVQRFGVENAGDFSENTLGGKLFADLNQCIEGIAAGLAGQHEGGRRAASGMKERARNALREDLDAIARTGRSLEKSYPELKGKFRLKSPMTDTLLLATARAFASYSAPFREKFSEYALPANFLEDLAADIAAFEVANREQIAAVNSRVSATRTVQESAARGMETIGRLDTVVRNQYRGNQVKLDEWTRARAVERGTGRGPAQSTPVTKSSSDSSVAA